MPSSAPRSHLRSRPASILLATAAALLSALLLLLTVILPAEFDRDPLGTGAQLGIRGISTAADRPSTLLSVDPHRPLLRDHRRFILAPFESIEFKYRLAVGDPLLFSWQASRQIVFDMHSEPQNAPPGHAESFDSGRANRQQGLYIAPFDGIHGWFFEHRGRGEAEILLTVHGPLTEATLFSDRQIRQLTITAPDIPE